MAADKGEWSFGTARAKITPKEHFWMGGFAARTRCQTRYSLIVWAIQATGIVAASNSVLKAGNNDLYAITRPRGAE